MTARALTLTIMLVPLFGADRAPAQCAAAPATGTKEGRIQSDFRREGQALYDCGKTDLGSFLDRGQTIVLGQPMHIAVGSLAPQSGTGAGLAFVEHKNFANGLRINWDIDAMATGNGSWRAGGYLKAFGNFKADPHPELPGASGTIGHVSGPIVADPLFNFYSQTISLNRVDYFGPGPHTTPLTHTTYGFTENISGINGILPVSSLFPKAHLSVDLEFNGRVPSVRPGVETTIPSITSIFSEADTPGLSHQPFFIQPSEGLRIEPALFKDRIRLNYLVQFQQFIASRESAYSFRRFNADFNHEIPLYQLLPGKLGALYSPNRSTLAAFQHNGPDDCTGSGSNISIARQAKAAANRTEARPCPIISTTQKLEGSIELRAYISESFAGQGSSVPFYFQPTIGGSNLNGTPILASYPDYRFRGPDLLLFRGTIEHSIGKLPIGGVFSVDEAKIGLRRDDVSIDHLRHTYSAGLTVHAGGLPVISLLFAWGGNEGTHTTATVSPSLLGGSGRPYLF